jgi:hypothetical protein
MRVRTALTRRQPTSATSRDGRRLASSPKAVTCSERCLVADLLYAVLLIGIFVVLALTLRGLEKL